MCGRPVQQRSPLTVTTAAAVSTPSHVGVSSRQHIITSIIIIIVTFL
jgi:hypothetical protein